MFPEDRKRIHDFLVARNWALDRAEVKANGVPSDPEARWDYRATFGDTVINQVSDVTPTPLSCHIDLDGDDTVLIVETAGNFRGCPAHEVREVYRVVVNGGFDPTMLGPILDGLEPAAQALDPHDLVECLFFGPCGTGSTD